MSEELLLVNPTPRRRRKKTVTSRTPVRRRKTNPTRQRSYAARGTGSPPQTRNRTPNPRRRRRKTYRKRRRNPVRRVTGIQDIVNQQIIPAAVGGSGALALDILMGYMPLPANLKIGPGRYLIKGVGAIGMGMLAEMMVNKSTARQLSAGALTVIMHDAMKEATVQFAPNIPLGGFNEYVSGLNEYVSGYPGELSPAGFSRVGYYSPAYPAGGGVSPDINADNYNYM